MKKEELVRNLPKILDFSKKRRFLWEELTSCVKRNADDFFSLGCMLGQMLTEKSYEKLGCENFAELCVKLGISDRRGRRLVHFACFTVDAQFILEEASPRPLLNVEFAERLLLAKEILTPEQYHELVVTYYHVGMATDELEAKLSLMAYPNEPLKGNLRKRAEANAQKFVSLIQKTGNLPCFASCCKESVQGFSNQELESRLQHFRVLQNVLQNKSVLNKNTVPKSALATSASGKVSTEQNRLH